MMKRQTTGLHEQPWSHVPPPVESVRTMGRESSIRRCITAYTDIKANESGLYWLLYWLSKYETAKARRALHCKINCVVCINI